MFDVIRTASRHFSQRRAAHRRTHAVGTSAHSAHWPMSRGDALAIGLGCDNYKR